MASISIWNKKNAVVQWGIKLKVIGMYPKVGLAIFPQNIESARNFYNYQCQFGAPAPRPPCKVTESYIQTSRNWQIFCMDPIFLLNSGCITGSISNFFFDPAPVTFKMFHLAGRLWVLLQRQLWRGSPVVPYTGEESEGTIIFSGCSRALVILNYMYLYSDTIFFCKLHNCTIMSHFPRE